MSEVKFPNEIWMEIFSYIDLHNLMELRLVCRHFHDLIEYRLNKDPEWKQVVDEAILFECQTQIMQRAYPYLDTYWSDVKDPVLWRGTYLSYKKWQKVLVYLETHDTIITDPTLGVLTCVCTFDKYIAIGFANGSISNYTVENIRQPFYLAHQNSWVKQIAYWYSNGEVLIVTVGRDYALRFWDLQNKVQISTVDFFASTISFGEYRHFCIGDLNGILTSYERDGPHITAGQTIDRRLVRGIGSDLMCHAFNGKYITSLAYNQGRTQIVLLEAIIVNGKLTEFDYCQIKDYSYISIPSNSRASMKRIVMPTIATIFGIGKGSIVSTNYCQDDWHVYNLDWHFGCPVRSIALYAEILMFGLDDGSLHLLHVDDYFDVMQLEEKIRNARKIQVDDVPIVEITVLEVDKKPCIVVITEQRAHLLNFF